MFFIASKILSFLTTPLIWIFVLLFIAYFQAIPKRKNRILLICIFLIYLFSNEFIFNEVVRQWEIPAKSQKEISNYEVGIILGGATTYDEELQRLQIHNSFDRVVQGVDLYKKGFISKLLISGGSGSLTFPDMKEAKFIKAYLLTIGIPERDIIIEFESKNTRENALFTFEELKKIGLQDSKLLLITSGYHMRRSQACFEKVGLQTTSYTTDRLSGTRRKQLDFLFLPNMQTLYNWRVIIHEWLGYVIYFLVGYV
ncbi:MAG: YdcF family protein [Bacteroidetes bacterium]|nr:YdcF family protein [Bacteroidota bacterium]HET6245851.1 YdcF family protein [Bacteroidia bacterium]